MQADQDMVRIGRVKLPRQLDDPEALRLGPGDLWIVSLEQGGGIAWYEGGVNGLLEAPDRVIRPKAINALPQNAGIEALAVLDFGRLMIISKGGSGNQRKVRMVDDAILESHDYRVSDGFEPVDAAELPNGDLLALAEALTACCHHSFLPGSPMSPHRRWTLATKSSLKTRSASAANTKRELGRYRHCRGRRANDHLACFRR